MKGKFFLYPVLALVNLGVLNAQAARMDMVLAAAEINSALASAMVLPAAGILDEHCTEEEAFQKAQALDFFSQGMTPEKILRASEVSLLIMRAFGFKGGFLYTLFPGPRYAYREMRYRDFLPDIADPGIRVSGEQLLYILGRVLTETEPEPNQGSERDRILEHIRRELETMGMADISVRITPEGITIILGNIQFLPDSGELMDSEKAKIKQLAQVLKEYPDRNLLVGGHTAMAGSAEGRRQISTQRAQAVADLLAALGCHKPEEILVRGYGAERPLVEKGAPEEAALNRRVEITLMD